MGSKSSPRPSEETFINHNDPENSEDRLLEDFDLFDHGESPSTTTPPRKVPLLGLPAYEKTYKLICYSRIAIFVLGFLAIPIPMFGGEDTLVPLLPIAVMSPFMTFLPMILVMAGEFGLKSRDKKDVRGEGERKRTAVLVEDPVTGRERWMLEPKPKRDPLDSWLDKRGPVAGIDVYCGMVILLAIVFAAVWGYEAPKTMVALILERAAQL